MLSESDRRDFQGLLRQWDVVNARRAALLLVFILAIRWSVGKPHGVLGHR